MKLRKTLCVLCCCLLLSALAPTAYAANVTASVCTDTVTLNGTDFNTVGHMYPKYPLLVYRDITYFPMTYHLCEFLGVATRWDGKTLYIDRTGSSPDGYSTEVTRSKPQGRVTSSTVSYPVVINGNTFDSKNAKWPLLNYQDVTYFPLTWDLAVNELGWDYQWDAASGLRIDSDGTASGTTPPSVNPNEPSDLDAEDAMVMQGIWRAFGPTVSCVTADGLTVELWSDWSISGIQAAILKGMNDSADQNDSLLNLKVTDIKVAYKFQFPSQVWSGMELTVPFTAMVQKTETYTLPSGKTFVPSGTTNELTAVVRLSGQGNPVTDSAFQAGQAMYKQLEKCCEIGEISVDANTVFNVMETIQSRITRNLSSAGLENQYYIQSVSLGSHKTVLNPGETMSVDFHVSFSEMPDASVPIDRVTISKQAVFKTK